MAKALNRRLFHEARRYIAGGVNSPVRSFKAVGGYPVFIRAGSGSKIYSECGREFIDYCLSFGALILGHSHPQVTEALEKTIKSGTSFGAPTKPETELAKIIVEAIPYLEQVRLTNSGTEAVMSAIRLARAFTKKEKIIKFAGAYHGHADYLLDCPGVPQNFNKYTMVLAYNNIKEAERIIAKYYKDIACVIVEPVAGNMGVVLPKPEFLKSLREITAKFEILLIFDEVITGFRVAYGGAQGYFNVKPDLTCLGKIIGGGLPIGAFGGRKEIMQLLSPQGSVYQAGTFSGNPLTVTAAIVTLKTLKKTNPYKALEEETKKLCTQIKIKAKKYKISLKVNYISSMFSVFFTEREVTNYQTAKAQNTELFKRFFHGLLKEGIYLSPSGFEANFLSTAHTTEDIEETLNAIDKTFSRL